MGDYVEEIAIGKIIKFISKIGVAAIRITSGELRIGDTIRIKGHMTDFRLTVESLHVEHENVEKLKLEKMLVLRL
jgi:hypothetical protein